MTDSALSEPNSSRRVPQDCSSLSPVKTSRRRGLRVTVFPLLLAIVSFPVPALSQEHASAVRFEPSPDEPMQFRMAGSGGNCLRCTWIAAEGKIVPGTAMEFAGFIDRTETAGSGLFVHLNSTGGDAAEAMELGRLIRSNGLNTAVSQTIGEEQSAADPKFDKFVTEPPTSDDETQPVCLSACALAFAGGDFRLAEETVSEPDYLGFGSIGTIGVQQLHAPKAWKMTDAGPSGADEASTILQIPGFLEEMGIDPRFLSIVAMTPPTEIHVLSGEELRKTNIVNADRYEADLKGHRNGTATVEVRFQKADGNYRVELFCKGQKIRMRVDADWHAAPTWEDLETWNLYGDVVLESPAVPVRLISGNAPKEQDAPVGELLFEFDTKVPDIASIKTFRFTQEPGQGNPYSADALASLGFTLPDDFEGLRVLPRTCL